LCSNKVNLLSQSEKLLGFDIQQSNHPFGIFRRRRIELTVLDLAQKSRAYAYLGGYDLGILLNIFFRQFQPQKDAFLKRAKQLKFNIFC
jgi:hypothetical protein